MADSNKYKENIAVTIALVVIAFFFIVSIFAFGLFEGTFVGNGGADNLSLATGAEEDERMIELESGLIIRNIQEGEGIAAEEGMVLTVHYRGQFGDGTVFDSSYERGEPFQFTLGEGQVIEGWEQGLLGMQVGGARTLVIPSHLAYGENDYGPIPGGSTLIFDVELLGVTVPESQ